MKSFCYYTLAELKNAISKINPNTIISVGWSWFGEDESTQLDYGSVTLFSGEKINFNPNIIQEKNLIMPFQPYAEGCGYWIEEEES